MRDTSEKELVRKHTKERKMKKRALSIIVILAVAVMVAVGGSSFSFAADAERFPNYVKGAIGAFQPEDDLDVSDYDTGFSGGVGYGRYFSNYFKIETSYEYYGTNNEVKGFNNDAGHYSRDDYIGVSSLLITLKAEVPIGPVDIFAGGGVGIYGAFYGSEIHTQWHGNHDGNDFDTVFGAHVSIGINCNITDRFFIGFDGKYHWTDEIELYDYVHHVPVSYDGNLNGYTLSFVAGFRF